MTNTETNIPQINLKQLIGQLINTYQSVAVQQHSFFINEVSPHLCTVTDADTLTTMMGSLLYIIARCSRDSCIHISTYEEDNITTISMKDNNAVANYAVLYEFHHLKMLAQQLQGFLDIHTERNKETVISFSFDNMRASAANGILRELKRA